MRKKILHPYRIYIDNEPEEGCEVVYHYSMREAGSFGREFIPFIDEDSYVNVERIKDYEEYFLSLTDISTPHINSDVTRKLTCICCNLWYPSGLTNGMCSNCMEDTMQNYSNIIYCKFCGAIINHPNNELEGFCTTCLKNNELN